MFSLLPTRSTQNELPGRAIYLEEEMTADEIIAVSDAMNCKPNTSAATFAKMSAEHCAHLGEEAERARASAARALCRAFVLAES